jgi:hypothetical protein
LIGRRVDSAATPTEDPVRKLIVSEFVTLDGVMQAPGGKDEDRDGGFEHGGWTLPYWHDDIGASFGALMKDVDALLLGRRRRHSLARTLPRTAAASWSTPCWRTTWSMSCTCWCIR